MQISLAQREIVRVPQLLIWQQTTPKSQQSKLFKLQRTPHQK